MSFSRRTFLIASAALAAPAIARAQGAAPIELKVTHWLPPVHQGHKWMVAWGEKLGKMSGDRIKVSVLAAGQMGPPQRQFGLASTGVADIGYFLPGFTPGRFPVTDLLQLPFLFNKDGSLQKPLSTAEASVVATSTIGELNKQKEYEGTKILFIIASPSGSLFMGDKAVNKPDDLKGLRVRHNGPVGAAQLAAWGASPVAVPPAEVSDAMSKGVIDGMIFNYEGGRAFQIGNAVKNVTELNWMATCFVLVMNQAKYDSLPADLRKMIDESTGVAAARELGGLYDTAEAGGRDYITKAGAKIIQPDAAAFKAFHDALTATQANMLKDVDGKGLPASAYYKRVRELVAGAKA